MKTILDFIFIPPILSYTDLVLLALRLVMGSIFLAHGIAKIKDLKGTQEWFGSIGFKPGVFWGTLVTFGEVIGGPLLMLGLATTFWGLFFGIQMIVVTIWKILKKQKLFGGFELDLLLVTCALILLAVGAGNISLDKILLNWYFHI